jgi:redox-sensitive bicupin YhaK (pirin superfamily)
MTIQFSPTIAVRERHMGDVFSVRSLDLQQLSKQASPVLVLDDFRVSGQPFGPHPHAGFSAATYVFPDSPGGSRSRDSLGNDIVVGPGGIVWAQAGSGLVHEEVPAQEGQTLHGLQFFVNLSARHKLSAPRVLYLAGRDVPEWHSATGDRVRVVVGAYRHVRSSLIPAEPFNLLDIELRREIDLELNTGYNALVYMVSGHATLRAEACERHLEQGRALALTASDLGRFTLRTHGRAHCVVLSGPAIDEPVVMQGPFIMNDREQIAAAIRRFEDGRMGRLEPLAHA